MFEIILFKKKNYEYQPINIIRFENICLINLTSNETIR